MKRHQTGMSNAEAFFDVLKTYRWPALFFSTALGIASFTRNSIRGVRR